MKKMNNSIFHLGFLPVIMFAVCVLNSCSVLSSKDKLEDEVQQIHRSMYTIDSHVDTPLRLMREGFLFSQYHDPYSTGSKIDLPRMREGELDGVFFAVFVGQGERSEEGNSKALERALRIVDSVKVTVNRNSDDLAFAYDSDDLFDILDQQKRAIFIGMENGYPLGNDLSLIDTFYQKGIRYITLCHTRNNDLCDSSTDDDGPEHKGLSSFGTEVVKRMNELGIMVDVSHASDKTFYDVLEMTSTPVIASHSCARTLCDNPRNLSDEMLVQLAKNGGVIQMCILSAYVETPEPDPARDSAKNAVYEKHGNYYDLDDEGRKAFLKDWYSVDEKYPQKLANVDKVVDHIDHIVKIAGIDHVGIGTDFDGGGGLADCFDVSELQNITGELLTRGYSKEDIQKIWGGNLLRVMKEVEAKAEKRS